MNKEFKIGIFTAVALALLYFGFQYLKGINFFSSVKRYYVVYDNVDKLAVSNPVYVNGYTVGRVSLIDILQGKQSEILVELEIQSNIILTDSTGALLSSDFLGGKSIQLIMRQGRRTLHSKDTLRAEVQKGMLDALSEKASPMADNLQNAIQKLSAVIDNLTVSTSHVNEILSKFHQTPQLLNNTLLNANGKIDLLSGQVTVLSGNLNATLKGLKPAIDNASALSDSLKKLRFNDLNGAIAGLHSTIKKLNKGDNTASKLLTDDAVYVNLNRLLMRLDSLAKHFDENPRHFLAPLGKSRKKIQKDRKK